MSSNSVASVTTLSRLFHIFVEGVEEEVRELASSASEAPSPSLAMYDGVAGRTGAARKCMPRGVGKWSLRGESHCSIFSVDCLFLLLQSTTVSRSWEGSSTMALRSLGGLLRACGEDGRKAVLGSSI